VRKTALVTGGSRGIGLGIAQALAKEGCAVAICGSKDESQAADAMASLSQLGAEPLYCKCDISKRSDRESMLESVKVRFGRLDFLINNAGIAPKERKDILDAEEESFELLLKTNLQGPYFLTQSVARWMIGQRKADPAFSGVIVNVSSISAEVASVSRGEYCVSKAGVSMASKLWAARLAEFGICVFEIRPGIIKTDMTSSVQGKYDKLIAEGSLLLQSRWGLPEDIGRAAAMLCRGDLAYSTGAVICVDGGMTVPRL